MIIHQLALLIQRNKLHFKLECSKTSTDKQELRKTLQTDTKTLHLLHELQVQQIELKMQNDELRDSEKKLNDALTHYKELFHFAPIGYFILSLDGEIIQINLPGAHLIDLDRTKLSGHRLAAFVSEPDRPVFNIFLKNVFEGGIGEACEVEFMSNDQTRYSVLIKANLSSDGQECRGVIMDITERNRREEKLKVSEERYRKYVEHAPLGIFVVDSKGKYVDVNLGACKLLGYTRDELLQLSISDISSMKDDVKNFQQLKKEGSLSYVGRLKRKDDSIVKIKLNAVALSNDQLMAFCTDITELKQAEEALRQSEATVRNKLKAITKPEGDIGTLELSDIIDTEILQSIMDDFYQLTKMGGTVIDVSGKILVAVGWQDICTKFHRCNPDTLKNCIESDTILTKSVPKGTLKAYRCKNNMWDTATPIMVEGRLLGNIFMGQYFLEDENPDVEQFREQARKYGFEEEEYLAALDRVPIFSKETVDRGMQFYSKLAGIISTLSFSTIQQSRMLTEGKLAEKTLEESEKHYRTLFNESPMPLWEEDFTEVVSYLLKLKKKGHKDLRNYFENNPNELMNCAGMIKILDVNQASIDLHKAKSKEQLIGNLSEILTEKSLFVFKNELLAVFEGKEIFESESVVKTLQGDLKYIGLTLKIDQSQSDKVKVLLATSDITERKQADKKQKLRLDVFEHFQKSTSLKNICQNLLSSIKEYFNCDAVALRLKDGGDYPYFLSNGFSKKFLKSENLLLSYDKKGKMLKDSDGRPALACMCGIVINAKFHPDKSFFTKEGSFWTNSTTELLASTSNEGRGTAPRNVCNKCGYKSVALIPVKKFGKNIGLLQINSKKENIFTLSDINLLENTCQILGMTIEKESVEDEIKNIAKFPSENPNLILRIDNKGLVLYKNPAVEILLRTLKLSEKSIDQILPEEIKPLMKKVFETGEAISNIETEIQKEIYLYSIFPVKEYRYANLYAVNISKQKHAENARDNASREVIKAYEKLSETFEILKKNQIKILEMEKLSTIGEFAAGVAHEINNPLATVLLSAQRMSSLMQKKDANAPDPEKYLTLLERIEKATRRCKQIVTILLDFSRPSIFHFTTVNINAVIKEALKQLEKPTFAKIIVKKDFSRLPFLKVDELQLNIVINNLIHNACDAMPEGGQLKITTKVQKSAKIREADTGKADRVVEIEFADTGKGISKDNMAKIFNPFFTTKEPNKGVGLGLFVSYGIIKGHNGTMEAESKGKGTTFTIRLPVK
ncbi:MAG: PocR ligand-binding domain-containing protein [Candidatus Theseobacter exili]|nr:PocR ligand-binding domain-containing protein [Candidatus Theseobacter exili]